MNKFKLFCDNAIRVMFTTLLLLILLINVHYLFIDNSKLFSYFFLALLAIFVVILLYRSRFINKKKYFLFFLIVIFVGTALRIYFIENTNFNLLSDFQFTFENATAIIHGTSFNANYLSYNGYSFMYSTILIILFKIFGESVNVVLYFNAICQLLTVFFIYKTINIKYSKETAILLSTTFYLLPTIFLANLLVSTETPFLLLFSICIFIFYKIKDKRDLNFKNVLLMVLFGICMSCTNYIRPVMTVFVIALIIYYALNTKKLKEILLLFVVLVSYSVTNTLFNAYVEKGIGMETRSGALGWSIYFGSNYDYCGSWSPEDSEFVTEVLEDPEKGDKDLILLSLERLQGYGIVKSTKLFGCKYRNLWRNNVGTYGFVHDQVDASSKIDYTKWAAPFESISFIIVIILLVLTIVSVVVEIIKKEEKWLFLELFGLGYILSNLLVCLNGRYNIPLYLILVIVCSLATEKIVVPREKEQLNREPQKINSKKPKILLIIPAYNEQENIKKTVDGVVKAGYDYIIINDGSTDNTELICKSNKFNYINIISNLGIGGAVQTGYKYAKDNGYDIAVQFDADGQHDVSYVGKLIKPIEEGKAHLVIGSRFIEKSSSTFQSTFLRRIGINIISSLIKAYSGERIYDTTSGFRAANREIIEKFSSDYPIEYPEPVSSFQLLRTGYKVLEIPVSMNERTGGTSSIVSWKKAYYMINVFLSIIVVHIRGEK